MSHFPTVAVVALPMNEVIDDVLLGSLNGTMTGGVSLVPGQYGSALYMSDGTGRVDLGFHQSQCFSNPDSCSQGVTFALWIKRNDGAGSGILFDTGGFIYESKGNYQAHLCVQSCVSKTMTFNENTSKIKSCWTINQKANNSENRHTTITGIKTIELVVFCKLR